MTAANYHLSVSDKRRGDLRLRWEHTQRFQTLPLSEEVTPLPDGKRHSNKAHTFKTSVEMFIVHSFPKQLLQRMYLCGSKEIKVYVQLMKSFTGGALHRLQHW